jgi:hypothetical protein
VFPISLIPIDIGSFDVIVGMDWMTRVSAKIVWEEIRSYFVRVCWVFCSW